MTKFTENKNEDEPVQSELRRKAERLAMERPPAFEARDPKVLLHELQVHQLELELQNEQLQAAQLALTESRDRYQTLYDLAPVGYLTLDRSGRIQEANLTAAALLGLDRPRLIRKALAGFLTEETADELHRHLQRVLASTEKHSCEVVLAEGPSGSRAQLDREPKTLVHIDSVSFVEPATDRVLCCSILSDWTELRRTEQKLRTAEARGQSLFDTTVDAIVITDGNQRIEALNHAAEQLFGYAEAEVRGKNLWLLLPVPALSQEAQKLSRGSGADTDDNVEPSSRETSGLRRDGTTFPCEVGMGEWWDCDQRKVMHIVHDVSARKAAERKLRESERWFRSIVENSVGGIAISEPDGRLLQANTAFADFLGCSIEELHGKSLKSFLHPDDRSTVEPAPRTKAHTFATWERRYLRKDGTVVWGHVTSTWIPEEEGAPRYAVWLLQDVTPRKLAEKRNAVLAAQLHQAQKLEAVGTLASGVAHDFNNLLMAIGSCSSIALMRMPEDSAAAPYLREIRDAVQHGAMISKQLVTFNRSREVAPRALDLNEAASATQKMLRRLLREDIEFRIQLEANPSRVRMDPGQLDQLLLNLAVNARDAMPKGGRLTLHSTTEHLTKSNRESLPPGDYVVLTVTDTGFGMEPTLLERIFEPFFTTKEPGRGTGLGLSTVYGIVKDAGGHIGVTSQQGKGTTFRILLPLTQEPLEEPSQATASHEPNEEQSVSGQKTVLLVEDERAVRMGARFYLEQARYRVIEAGNGSEAIQRCREHGGAIDLLLTDIVLPGMDGTQVAAEIKRLQPSITALYMSAYEQEWLIAEGRVQPDAPMIQKPFDAETLLQRVRGLLDPKPRRNRSRCSERERTVLVVEDQSAARRAIGEYLSESGWNTLTAENAEEALSLCDQLAVDHDDTSVLSVLLTDYSLPGMKGDALAQIVKERYPNVGIVYMSGLPDLTPQPPGVVLAKPINLQTISETLQNAAPNDE